MAGVGAGPGGGRTAHPVRRSALAFSAYSVLPPQVDGVEVGAHARRRAAAGAAGAGQPAPGQARGDTCGPRRCVAQPRQGRDPRPRGPGTPRGRRPDPPLTRDFGVISGADRLFSRRNRGEGNPSASCPRRKWVLEEFLRQHDGVITLAQARRCGLSADAVIRRQRSGRWVRCGPGVYFVDDRPFAESGRVRAAVWSYGVRAAASGLAAAWWLDLTKF